MAAASCILSSVGVLFLARGLHDGVNQERGSKCVECALKANVITLNKSPTNEET
jgi:hypothetical protein